MLEKKWIALSTQLNLTDNSTKYNLEFSMIRLAQIDYLKRTLGRQTNLTPLKELLCVTFIKASLNPSLALFSNIHLMGSHCEWAIIIYDGDARAVNSICSNKSIRDGNVVHCRRAPLSVSNRTASIPTQSKSKSKRSRVRVVVQKLSVPKTVLYRELLPHLRHYRHALLLDEDISLLGFDLPSFAATVRCAFSPAPPLIAQPAIAESNQFFQYVNLNSWQRSPSLRAVALAESGLVEQQVPYFDSLFFEWFVRHVLAFTKDTALFYGVDWGHDMSWCRAAKMYSVLVLNRSIHTAVCAIAPGATPVHHLDTNSITNKHLNRSFFRIKSNKVVPL
jgi:hypothetical protein